MFIYLQNTDVIFIGKKNLTMKKPYTLLHRMHLQRQQCSRLNLTCVNTAENFLAHINNNDLQTILQNYNLSTEFFKLKVKTLDSKKCLKLKAGDIFVIDTHNVITKLILCGVNLLKVKSGAMHTGICTFQVIL